jgi:hypothetical protein
MADERELVTVFRSAEADGEVEADQIQNLLAEAGLHSGIFDDTTPGVVAGTWEVRVPADEAARAEQIIAANPGGEDSEGQTVGDPSHALDTEMVYRSMGTQAEMQAMSIQGMLAASGIEAILMGDSVLPQLGFEIRVARDRAEEAQSLIRQAEATDLTAEEAEPIAPEG